MYNVVEKTAFEGAHVIKKVVSVSLGASSRDHAAELTVLGEEFRVERRGTDGDMRRAIRMIQELDGKVDAIGLGGIDLYLVANGRRYVIKDAKKMASAAKRTPVVDGSGLKNTLERRVIKWLDSGGVLSLKGRKVLLVSGVDRFGMAEAMFAAGCDVTMGDLMFALGIPIPIRSLRALDLLARCLLPILCQLPFQMLYPTGSRQEKATGGAKYARYFEAAEVIAGDFHYIKRYMPPTLTGKVIITNTVTKADIDLLRRAGVRTLVTTTPEIKGRSFGTNVIEAMLVALAGKQPAEMSPADYDRLLDKIGFEPRLDHLNHNRNLEA